MVTTRGHKRKRQGLGESSGASSSNQAADSKSEFLDYLRTTPAYKKLKTKVDSLESLENDEVMALYYEQEEGNDCFVDNSPANSDFEASDAELVPYSNEAEDLYNKKELNQGDDAINWDAFYESDTLVENDEDDGGDGDEERDESMGNDSDRDVEVMEDVEDVYEEDEDDLGSGLDHPAFGAWMKDVDDMVEGSEASPRFYKWRVYLYIARVLNFIIQMTNMGVDPLDADAIWETGLGDISRRGPEGQARTNEEAKTMLRTLLAFEKEELLEYYELAERYRRNLMTQGINIVGLIFDQQEGELHY